MLHCYSHLRGSSEGLTALIGTSELCFHLSVPPPLLDIGASTALACAVWHGTKADTCVATLGGDGVDQHMELNG